MQITKKTRNPIPATMIPKVYGIKETDKETLRHWYYQLKMGRLIDEKAPQYRLQSQGWSLYLPYPGHDGIQLAIGHVFEPGADQAFLYYRDLLSALCCGMTPEEILLNGLSKATDLTGGGRHMSGHWCKLSVGIQGVSSCVGSHDVHAVGLARAFKYYGHKGVTIASHGESTTSEGYVYEAINGASREGLPVIFVIQDNGYGISVPKREQTGNIMVGDNFGNMKGITIMHCNGKDVFDSVNVMTAARKHAIETSSPVIVHASCVRIGAHSNSDDHVLYRDEDEIGFATLNDPVEKYRRMLLRYKRFTENELKEIEDEAKADFKKANKAALSAPDPDPKTVLEHITPTPYKADKYGNGVHDLKEGEKLTYVQAINRVLKDEFRRNPDTFMWGQDVASKNKGGVFNVSKGMQAEFGRDRVFNGPIAEDYIVGTANGMSRYDDKIRIVIEGAEFADYFWPAMEQFVNTTHEYWRSNGQFAPNITLRLASGAYIGGGLYHSQTIEASLTPLPGARIVYPAFADDAAGLLRTAIRSRGLTVMLEPKLQYNSADATTIVPDDFEVPFGKGRVRFEGDALTLVTYGNTVMLSLKAAKKLEEETGKRIEVIDLRSLSPWDKDLVYESIKKTSKCLVVHEDKKFAGFGGEIAASISEDMFRYLDAPVRRVGALDTPIGFHENFEFTILPSIDDIYDAAKELVEY